MQKRQLIPKVRDCEGNQPSCTRRDRSTFSCRGYSSDPSNDYQARPGELESIRQMVLPIRQHCPQRPRERTHSEKNQETRSELKGEPQTFQNNGGRGACYLTACAAHTWLRFLRRTLTLCDSRPTLTNRIAFKRMVRSCRADRFLSLLRKNHDETVETKIRANARSGDHGAVSGNRHDRTEGP